MDHDSEVLIICPYKCSLTLFHKLISRTFKVPRIFLEEPAHIISTPKAHHMITNMKKGDMENKHLLSSEKLVLTEALKPLVPLVPVVLRVLLMRKTLLMSILIQDLQTILLLLQVALIGQVTNHLPLRAASSSVALPMKLLENV